MPVKSFSLRPCAKFQGCNSLCGFSHTVHFSLVIFRRFSAPQTIKCKTFIVPVYSCTVKKGGKTHFSRGYRSNAFHLLSQPSLVTLPSQSCILCVIYAWPLLFVYLIFLSSLETIDYTSPYTSLFDIDVKRRKLSFIPQFLIFPSMAYCYPL